MEGTHLDGPRKDKEYLAIYKLEGDILTLCSHEERSEKYAPLDFASDANSDLSLIVLKRKKP